MRDFANLFSAGSSKVGMCVMCECGVSFCKLLYFLIYMYLMYKYEKKVGLETIILLYG